MNKNLIPPKSRSDKDEINYDDKVILHIYLYYSVNFEASPSSDVRDMYFKIQPRCYALGFSDNLGFFCIQINMQIISKMK